MTIIDPAPDGRSPLEADRIHYVAYNGRHLAGLVIGKRDDDPMVIDLVLFTNLANVNGDKNFGMQFHQDVKQDTMARPGTWHYPEY